MARNLQAKLPSTDTLRVFDVNAESVERFAKETKALGSGAAVETANSVREAAEDSVGLPYLPILAFVPYMMSLFYQ